MKNPVRSGWAFACLLAPVLAELTRSPVVRGLYPGGLSSKWHVYGRTAEGRGRNPLLSPCVLCRPIRHSLLDGGDMAIFHLGQFAIEQAQRARRGFRHQIRVVPLGAAFGAERHLQSAVARADYLLPGSEEKVPLFQARNFNQLHQVLFRQGATGGPKAFYVRALQLGTVVFLFRRHLLKDAGDLQRIAVPELGKHFREPLVKLSVALLDEDCDVQGFLRIERSKTPFHGILREVSGLWRNCIGKGAQSCAERAEVLLFSSEMGNAGGDSRLSYRLFRRLRFCLGLLSRLLGSIGFNARDGPLEPVLYVLPQLLFRLAGRGDRNSLPVQRNVMTRRIFRAVFLGDEVIQQALTAGVRARGIAVVGAGQRILKNGSRPPRGAVPVSIAPLLQEVEFVAQYLEHIAFIFRHNPSNFQADSTRLP